jgi:choline dehydrogenase-like flavoprotein
MTVAEKGPSRLKPSEAPAQADYDYVIVGGGSAGCVMANRLSANPANRVLLLEAGGPDNWIWFHIPVGYLFAIGNPRSDWMYRTEAEPGLNGRSLAYPRGKVIGGSSAINAMISMRGQAADYDGWRAMGLPGWGWSDVLPVFREIEDHFLGSSEHHGAGGEWRVEAPRLRWDVLDAVARAATEMGIAQVADFNAGGDEGVGYFHVNQKRGLRWSSARGFLDPVRKRPNLAIETGALVETLMLDGKCVTGVRYSVGGQSRSAVARSEVVLCAGSIGTPHLLQRSGIGPAATLQGAGIPVQHDLPGVGGNLQDHLQQRAIFRVAGIRTLNETYHSLPRRAAMGLDFALRRRGPLTMAPSQLGIFTRSSPDQERPNLQFHVQPLSLDRFGEPLHRFPAITVSACNLRPTSRGSVRAISPNAGDAPKIAPNYLSTDQDRKIAADAIRVTRRLMNQAAIKPYVASELVPGPQVSDSDADLARAAGDIGTTIFHPVGTARMGMADDPDAVVDERLRVIGLSGLRIADASIMPTIVSGNTNTPTIMIAAMAAKFILQDER